MIISVWFIGLIATLIFPEGLITAIQTQDEDELRRTKNYATVSLLLILAALVVTVIAA